MQVIALPRLDMKADSEDKHNREQVFKDLGEKAETGLISEIARII